MCRQDTVGQRFDYYLGERIFEVHYWYKNAMVVTFIRDIRIKLGNRVTNCVWLSNFVMPLTMEDVFELDLLIVSFSPDRQRLFR